MTTGTADDREREIRQAIQQLPHKMSQQLKRDLAHISMHLTARLPEPGPGRHRKV